MSIYYVNFLSVGLLVRLQKQKYKNSNMKMIVAFLLFLFRRAILWKYEKNATSLFTHIPYFFYGIKRRRIWSILVFFEMKYPVLLKKAYETISCLVWYVLFFFNFQVLINLILSFVDVHAKFVESVIHYGNLLRDTCPARWRCGNKE